MKLCFLLSMAVMSVAVDAFEFDYEFPATRKELVHGLCAKGLTFVSATSNLEGLTYDLVENLQDGMPLWATDTADASHSEFVGEGGFCEEGTYIQPSKHNNIPALTTISIQGFLPLGAEATICYFVDSSAMNRDGGWGQLPDFEYVKDYQWDTNRVTDILHKDGWLGSAKIYCRTIVNEDKSEDKSINLLSSVGFTDYPSGAVKVVSSDTSTVTVQLRQTWGATIDKFFYQYKPGLFSERCFEENAVKPSTVVDTITIQCKLMYPVAYLKLCLQDTTGSLLEPVDDQGTVPRCCHSDAPQNTPTVCYNVEIDCSDNTQSLVQGLELTRSVNTLATPTDTLISGQTLMEDQQLKSPNGEYRLIMQADGNLVAYHGAVKASNAYWSSGTAGKGKRPFRFTVTSDGNAVIYDGTGTAIWSTGTDGTKGDRVVIQDDRNILLYTNEWLPLWDANMALKPLEFPTDTLKSGQTLDPGQKLKSSNGKNRLVMQADGNLVAYTGDIKPSNAYWSSLTAGKGKKGPFRLTVTPDGNAVIYDGTGEALASTGTGGDRVVLQDDRNIVLYTNEWLPLWAAW